jgi:uncharacterized protein with von Willebrand factor type A (vWA) domain
MSPMMRNRSEAPAADERLLHFIAALRGAGVRISLTESQNAAHAAASVGIANRPCFKAALKASLVKERHQQVAFEQLFPLYFGPRILPGLPAAQALSPEAQEQLRQALEALQGHLGELLRQLLSGQRPTSRALQQAMEQAGLRAARGLDDVRWLAPRTLEELGLPGLLAQLGDLLKALEAAGMVPAELERVKEWLQANLATLQAEAEQAVGMAVAQRLLEYPPALDAPDGLLDRRFDTLTNHELDQLQDEVRRLAARLRTRADLRHRRGKGRSLDAKATLRAGVRTRGFHFTVIHRVRRLRPRFTILCDMSTSMRPAVWFLLMMIYQIQDQVGRTRCFGFIDHLEDISEALNGHRPEVAIPTALEHLPPGYYNTDLGSCLIQLIDGHGEWIDRRTTLIICGDGRNNFNPARADLLDGLARRAHKVIWCNPEAPRRWGSGDSDMLEYAPLVGVVYQVANLRQLSLAFDQLFLG